MPPYILPPAGFDPERPVKLATRSNGDWIEAVICFNVPGGESLPDALLISTLSVQAARKDRQLFEDWKKGLMSYLGRFVQSATGKKIAEIMEFGNDAKKVAEGN